MTKTSALHKPHRVPDMEGRNGRGHKLWSFTNNMNMRDLSRNDDFLSYMLLESFGTGTTPLVVHRMDPTRRMPPFDPTAILQIVQKWLLGTKLTPAKRIRGAVDDLLHLSAVRQFLKTSDRSQINAFATHAARYLEIYLPSSTTEIAHTSRYSHRTGKPELCILATRDLPVGTVISELKGSMAVLTEEENEELKRTDKRNTQGIRRDFSVIHSGHRKKNNLFLGPARFVNHDCGNNCDLIREGRYITFRVVKPIMAGQELTAHYGDSYFGKRNRHCLCETCELGGKGAYRVEAYTDSDHSSDSDVSMSSEQEDTIRNIPVTKILGASNERRTRRGVYRTVASSSSDDESDGSEESLSDLEPLDVPCIANEAVRIRDSSTIAQSSIMPIPASPQPLNILPPSPILTPPVASNDSDCEIKELIPDVNPVHLLSTPRSTRQSTRLMGTPLSTVTTVTPLSTPTPSVVHPMTVQLVNTTSSPLVKRKRGRPPKSSYITQPILNPLPTPIQTTSEASTSPGPARSLRSQAHTQVKLEVVDPVLLSLGKRTCFAASTETTPTSFRSTRQSGTAPRTRLIQNSSSEVKKSSKPTVMPATLQTVTPKRKRGRPPKQPPVCIDCRVVIKAEQLPGLSVAKSLDSLRCARCHRHYTIFLVAWPSRNSSRILSLPSPTPDSSPEPLERPRKRKFDSGGDVMQQSKRRRIISVNDVPRYRTGQSQSRDSTAHQPSKKRGRPLGTRQQNYRPVKREQYSPSLEDECHTGRHVSFMKGSRSQRERLTSNSEPRVLLSSILSRINVQFRELGHCASSSSSRLMHPFSMHWMRSPESLAMKSWSTLSYLSKPGADDAIGNTEVFYERIASRHELSDDTSEFSCQGTNLSGLTADPVWYARRRRQQSSNNTSALDEGAEHTIFTTDISEVEHLDAEAHLPPVKWTYQTRVPPNKPSRCGPKKTYAANSKTSRASRNVPDGNFIEAFRLFRANFADITTMGLATYDPTVDRLLTIEDLCPESERKIGAKLDCPNWSFHEPYEARCRGKPECTQSLADERDSSMSLPGGFALLRELPDQFSGREPPANYPPWYRGTSSTGSSEDSDSEGEYIRINRRDVVDESCQFPSSSKASLHISHAKVAELALDEADMLLTTAVW